LEDNPQLPIYVAPAIDEIMDGSRQVFTPSISNQKGGKLYGSKEGIA
jgi:hypothetical protein